MLFILAGNGLRLFAAYSADSFLTAVIFSSSASVQPFLDSPIRSSPGSQKKKNQWYEVRKSIGKRIIHCHVGHLIVKHSKHPKSERKDWTSMSFPTYM